MRSCALAPLTICSADCITASSPSIPATGSAWPTLALTALREAQETRREESRYADHRGHALMVTGDIYWCSRCGLYTVARVRGLALECNTKPKGGRYSSSVLRRLKEGKHPRTGARLFLEPRRLLSWEWDRLVGLQAPSLELVH